MLIQAIVCLFFENFNTVYFYHILSHLPMLPRSFPLPMHATSWSFSPLKGKGKAEGRGTLWVIDQICVSQLLVSLGPVLVVCGWLSRITPLKKTYFPSPSSYYFVDSQARWGTVDPGCFIEPSRSGTIPYPNPYSSPWRQRPHQLSFCFLSRELASQESWLAVC